MDKQTLSNYGWIVIVTLILAVLLAMATPFGNFVGDAVVNVANGLVGTSNSATDEDNIKNKEKEWMDKLNGGVENPNDDTTELPSEPEPEPEPDLPSYDATAPELNPDDGTTPQNGDVYYFGDYKYTYTHGTGTYTKGGWKVTLNLEVTDKTKSSYGPILESINKKPIIALDSTFEDCKNLVESPIIPSQTQSIKFAYKNCTSLETAPKIPDDMMYMINTFYGCSSLKVAPEIPSGATRLSGAFYACKNLEVAPKLSHIKGNGSNAYDYYKGELLLKNIFAYCEKLKTYAGSNDSDGDFSNYILPNDVQSLEGAFMYCKSIVKAPNITANTNCTGLRQTFWYCENLVSAPIIESSIATLDHTFYACYALSTYNGSTDNAGDFSNYKLPTSVKNMDYAFWNCDSVIKAPEIPSNVTTLEYAFSNSDNLQEIGTIPNSVTNMHGTFSSCASLKKITNLPNSVTDLSQAFSGCKSLEGHIDIPASATDLFYAFRNCEKITSVSEISGNVTSLDSTFAFCTSLKTTPKLPDTVTNMEEAFRGCTSLITITNIPKNATNMKETFMDCTSLQVVLSVIPETVTDLHRCFAACPLVGTVKIPCTIDASGVNWGSYGSYTIETYHITNCEH